MNNEEILNTLQNFLNKLRKYHDHEVIGMEHIPQEGRGLIVFNHSLATYDMSLLFAAIFADLGRIPRPLTDHLFFKIPYLGQMVELVGGVEGNPQNAEKMLEEGNLVAVAPGGMRESLRPSSERYQILWEKRKGFVALALRTQTPIIIAICPKADDIYDVYPSPLTKWAYQKFKVPVFLARGIGLSPIPKPVKLIHFIDKPLIPPVADPNPEGFKKQVDALHRKVVARAHKLIGVAVAHRD